MSALIADIGGTNTRCAVADPARGLDHIVRFRNAEYGSLGALLARYLENLPPPARPSAGVLAVAAPVQGDLVRMINLPWEFSALQIRAELGLRRLDVINDFEAQAWALTRFTAADVLKVGPGEARLPHPQVVIGPGTGLGVAALVPCGTGWKAIPGEGGHVTLPAQDDVEERVIRRAREELGHCSAERFLSGPGLRLLDAALHGREPRDAALIGNEALAGNAQALQTLEVFFRFLGTMAGNLALTFGATGGVYIAGGVVPRYASLIAASGFRDRFENKGRYVGYLRSIPTFVVTAADPGLEGLVGYVSCMD